MGRQQALIMYDELYSMLHLYYCSLLMFHLCQNIFSFLFSSFFRATKEVRPIIETKIVCDDYLHCQILRNHLVYHSAPPFLPPKQSSDSIPHFSRQVPIVSDVVDVNYSIVLFLLRPVRVSSKRRLSPTNGSQAIRHFVLN